MMKKILLLFAMTTLFVGCESIFGNKEADCVITGQITVTEDSSGYIRFLGEVENTGETKACFVKVTFVMKDSSDNILDIEFTYVNSTHLDPGQKSSFDCRTAVEYTLVSSWSYEITWDECD